MLSRTTCVLATGCTRMIVSRLITVSVSVTVFTLSGGVGAVQRPRKKSRPPKRTKPAPDRIALIVVIIIFDLDFRVAMTPCHFLAVGKVLAHDRQCSKS